jgi:hypothetical protein
VVVVGGGACCSLSLLNDVEQKPSVKCTTRSKQHRQTGSAYPTSFQVWELSIEFEAVSVFAIQKSFQQVILFGLLTYALPWGCLLAASHQRVSRICCALRSALIVCLSVE